jgi:rhodanese-related sulfurtransferase
MKMAGEAAAKQGGGAVPASIEREEVRRLIAEEDAQVVEVLPKAEFDWAHLAGAVHLHLKELDAHTAGRLDRDRPVIVYCNDFQ